MSTPADPFHPLYLDEAAVRGEMTRVFDVCKDCRRCVSLCSSFPTLFAMIDQVADRDAGRLTPAQQNQVVEECHQCSLCAIGCPFHGRDHNLDDGCDDHRDHVWDRSRVDEPIDVPRLMLRTKAMMVHADQVATGERLRTGVIARTDLVGSVATRFAPSVNRVLSARPGGIVRRLLALATGVSSTRQLPLFDQQRFSAWFKRRPTVRIGKRHGTVALFPTCIVEHQQPSIGHDLVKVYERNGVEVSLADVDCCGAPWLHSGDTRRFAAVAERNIAALAGEIRNGSEIVVPQPTCGAVLKQAYLDHVPGPDAELVAEHTFDASEYLIHLHRSSESRLDTSFDGVVPATITYHAPCQLRAQRIGLKSRDLMRLTGASIRVVQQCSGVDGVEGFRASADHLAAPIGHTLAAEIRRAPADVVAGDCHLSNTVIASLTDVVPLHPLQVLARAYGIAVEEPSR